MIINPHSDTTGIIRTHSPLQSRVQPHWFVAGLQPHELGAQKSLPSGEQHNAHLIPAGQWASWKHAFAAGHGSVQDSAPKH